MTDERKTQLVHQVIFKNNHLPSEDDIVELENEYYEVTTVVHKYDAEVRIKKIDGMEATE